jgi:hypothetical protein
VSIALGDTLLRYVEEQVRKGYQPSLIKEQLVRQGYSPALIDGIVDSVMMQQLRSEIKPGQPEIGLSQEKTAFPKIFLVILFIGIVVAGIILVPKLINPKEALLDIKVSSEKQTYYPGDSVGFDLEITNMGSSERFDINLIYRLLSSSDVTVVSKEETLAISTTTSHHRTIDLPSTTRPGIYVLKIFANYEGKVATSSFSFDVMQKQITKESCADGTRNQDETNVDCGGVCTGVNGAYWYDNSCHTSPKGTTPQPGTCSDGLKNQDETNVDCGGACNAVNGAYWYDGSCHRSSQQITPIPIGELTPQDIIINATATAATNPEKARMLCSQLESSTDKDTCYDKIAQVSDKQEYCALIVDTNTRDLCYKPFFFEHKDFTVCEKLTDPGNRQACEQLRELQKIMEEMNKGNNETAGQMLVDSTAHNYFND